MAKADGHGHGPGDVGQFAAALAASGFGEPAFDGEEEEATDEEGDGDREKFFREFESAFFHEVAAGAGDEEGGDDFKEVVMDGFVAPVENKLVEAGVEEGDDGQDGAGLDDDVEEVALAREPLLGDEEVAGGGDGKEFGDAFDDAEDERR